MVKFLVRVSMFLVRVSKNLGTACYLVLMMTKPTTNTEANAGVIFVTATNEVTWK